MGANWSMDMDIDQALTTAKEQCPILLDFSAAPA